MPVMPAQAVLVEPATRTVAQMRYHRRVLLIAAPAADDPRLLAQRHTLAAWRQEAADRDVSVVELIGRNVSGAADTGEALRVHYRLALNGFAVALIGKDGHEAYRSSEPVRTERLQGLIDAMPMRRAGQR